MHFLYKPFKTICLYVPGEGEAVGPGEEIPQFDWRKELPQVLHSNERGEGTTEPLLLSSDNTHTHTLSAPGL